MRRNGIAYDAHHGAWSVIFQVRPKAPSICVLADTCAEAIRRYRELETKETARIARAVRRRKHGK